MTQEINSRLDRVESALITLAEESQALRQELRTTNTKLDDLIEHLSTQRDGTALDVVDIKDDLRELKDVTKQQSAIADRYAISAQLQAETVKIQAENIRLMIESMNRKLA
ncbi:MAG: hypothetical protein ACOYN8_02600 [Pseudanabaena sp.]|jgi:hypothetical protein